MTDTEPCRLKNNNGSEYGTCPCKTPKDCPDPPLFTPVGIRLAGIIDQWMVKHEDTRMMNWIAFAVQWPIVQCRYLLWDVKLDTFVAAELRGSYFYLDNGKIVTPENNLYHSHHACVSSPPIHEVADWKRVKNLL